ncbi:MAG TPA: HlyD family type I secretion periplasmic adaptor subunit [Rhodopseudomonas sp.]|uniref:HlyD family type I secretion periplasmic adaptor subunit n=1 Tax=Rhodopseudomonas sp. TaxID=1078 RepID=UPI002ED80C84
MTTPLANIRGSLTRHIWAAGIASGVLIFGLGGWATTTEFSGAVIAQGLLVVDSNVKKVQHPTGGVVGEVRVKEGDLVDAGDILLRLDETQTRANVAIITKALDELAARQAREEAERDGEDVVAFPPGLLDRIGSPDVAKAIRGERTQFEVRRQTRNGQRSQLRERVAQLREEIAGYEAQIGSKLKQSEWIIKELEGVDRLWKQNLVPYTRVTTLEREKERLDGERGQLLASIAQSKGKITETEIQILQIDQDMRTEVGKDLADIRGKIAELVEKKVAAEDLLRRIDIRAPQAGRVLQLSIHTVGGVISAGEQIMLIVPNKDMLSVEVRLQPQDIDQVELDQLALIRFSSFSQRSVPELIGSVKQISADVSEDQKNGSRYYTLRIGVPEDEIKRLGGLKLIPGMPVEAFVQTTPRTVMSFLTKPLNDQIAHAFREK